MQDESSGIMSRKQTVQVTLEDGTAFYIQAKTFAGESNVGIKAASFEKVTQAIEGVAQKLSDIWKKVEPNKASVELGVEFAWEANDLLAIFVDNSAAASMKITLEWNKTKSNQ